VNPLNWFLTARQYANKPAYDLVVVRFWLPFMGPCLGTVTRLLKGNTKRIVAITDNVTPHESRPGDSIFTRYFLSSCHAFVAMSRAVLNDLRRFEPEKPAFYHPHPIYDNYGSPMPTHAARAALGLEQNTPYMLFFGLIRAYKGLDLLLEAYADGRLRKMGVKLIIAGEFYEPAEHYEEIIERLGLEDFIVKATRFIPSQEVALYFSAADLIVQPYRTATQSGVTQVAYHFGKPMLVTDVGGLSEIVTHGRSGYVVQPEPEAIASAIVDFYENDRYQIMAEEVEKRKAEFSWESFAQKLL
jgi:glycosyltransferase involved in cell wall biosynthesis